MKQFIVSLILFACISQLSCKKYLDKKSDKKLTIPSTVEDLQALLDNYIQVTQRDAMAGEASADNYYVLDATYRAFAENLQRIYTWQKDYLFEAGANNDWSNTYNKIYRADVVLTTMDQIDLSAADQATLDDIRGQALFLRGKSFQVLAFTFSLTYDKITSSTDPGIPLRLDADFNKISVRSTVQQTYDQIIADFKAAIPLLPILPLHSVRASRPAACALLARTYLAMREYDSCLKYADACLQLKNDLLNYNGDPEIVPTAASPIMRYNKEVIYDGNAQGNITLLLSATRAIIDSNLYRSYQAKDLRKTLFFLANTGAAAGTFRFKGSYLGGSGVFTGVATNEVYLMRAECNARKNNITAAMNDLNTLMAKRWANGFFIPFTAATSTEALDKILIERRKELLLCNLRWMDIKRLNKEGGNIILKRVIDGQTHTLPPNSNRYALPIPEDVINITGMAQNNRD